MDGSPGEASRDDDSERVGGWQGVRSRGLEELRCQSQRRKVLRLEVDLVHRAEAKPCYSATGLSSALTIEYGQAHPHFRARENSVRHLWLVLKARSEIRELVVPEVQKIEIECITLGYRRVLDAHRKARVQVSVRSLGAGSLGVQ